MASTWASLYARAISWPRMRRWTERSAASRPLAFPETWYVSSSSTICDCGTSSWVASRRRTRSTTDLFPSRTRVLPTALMVMSFGAAPGALKAASKAPARLEVDTP